MKPIVALDTETTGLNPKEDYIIQLSGIKFNPETFEVLGERNWYIEPIHKYEITPGAFEAHGITKEFLKEHGRSIKEVGPEFIKFMEGCDVLTYNGNSFDMKFIDKDLRLIGLEFNFEGRQFYDSFAMECKFNPRNLSTVYKNYTGLEMEGAHDALNDVRATIEVFKGQQQKYNLIYEDLNAMEENQLISPEGSIRYAQPAEGEKIIVFAVGKYKDMEFMKIMKDDPGYIKWYMGNVASEYTKNILRKYYAKHRDELKK